MRYLRNQKPVRGYTLLELIVALGLFSIVMLIVMGVYLALISYDRQARATNQLVANLSFAVESMVRNIRTGTDYTCTGEPCANIAFHDSQGTVIGYCVRSDGTLGHRTGGGLVGNDCVASASTVSLTDPRIKIENLAFYVRGVGTSGAAAVVQPQVTVVVRGAMNTDAGEEIAFTIQTSGTQRLLDIP